MSAAGVASEKFTRELAIRCHRKLPGHISSVSSSSRKLGIPECPSSRLPLPLNSNDLTGSTKLWCTEEALRFPKTEMPNHGEAKLPGKTCGIDEEALALLLSLVLDIENPAKSFVGRSSVVMVELKMAKDRNDANAIRVAVLGAVTLVIATRVGIIETVKYGSHNKIMTPVISIGVALMLALESMEEVQAKDEMNDNIDEEFTGQQKAKLIASLKESKEGVVVLVVVKSFRAWKLTTVPSTKTYSKKTLMGAMDGRKGEAY
ncbi:hypothetical protein RHSIM_RhsimUnG0229700 [Rhododendron simsii]|uniref:Uncharacterized protein n=1 Tax=Rhododendron simsii TaxID=118357 RepID=A0A834FTJ0_RHOSS|nr:hypothetical protein RHSIM_RhsimUnG0229700 [Rhododendron simsii]